MTNGTLKLEERLRQRIGRPSRVRSVAIRFTEEEAATLNAAAQSDGTTLREWSRHVLLDAAGATASEALFTELVATRMLLVNLIKPLILGEKVSPTWITEAMTMVRKEKHKAAQDVMQQYTQDAGKER
jgi:hypothetical protein